MKDSHRSDRDKTDMASATSETSKATSSSRNESSRVKQSLQHILTAEIPDTTARTKSQMHATTSKSPLADTPTSTPSKQKIIWVDDNQDNMKDGADTPTDLQPPSEDLNGAQTLNPGPGSRSRTANPALGSVFTGNKIKHLKKEDGIPLWRGDIQLNFLQCVFEDTSPVFTKFHDGKKNCSFAEIYVDAMARSGKTSKVLKEKMLADHVGAQSMAMICLLVNIGRMNTTLNCMMIPHDLR